jgi:1,4-dihydroxy-2-naphthoate octaprenyltransferase
MRAPFLVPSATSLLVAAVLGGTGSWPLFAAAALGTLALHVAANTFNDYFDHTSGTDALNEGGISPFTGGSRAIQRGLISPRAMLWLAIAALGAGACCGLLLALAGRPAILWYGVIGAGTAYFYTAPPLRLCARRGLGELVIGLDFGPLAVSAAHYALTGRVELLPVLLGLPLGLLTSAIILVNEIPDAPADAKTGKTHLVVLLGARRARFGHPLLVAASYAILIATVAVWDLSWTTLAPLAALPLAIYASAQVLRHYATRALARGCASTILLQGAFALLLALGLALS